MEEKPKAVVAICPACGKKFRDDPEQRIILTQSAVYAKGPALPPEPSLPKILCIACGVEFFPPAVLDEIKRRISGETGRIVVPGAGGLSLVKN